MKVENQFKSDFALNNSSNLTQKAALNKTEGNNSIQSAKQENVSNVNLSEELDKIAEKLNEQAESLGTNIKFGFNSEVNSMYLSVIEKQTGEVIRQIPSEEALKLAEHFQDVMGMIFDKEG